MSRENKFILGVLVVLVGVFSYVVFRKLQAKSGPDAEKNVAESKDKNETGENPTASIKTPEGEAGKKTPEENPTLTGTPGEFQEPDPFANEGQDPKLAKQTEPGESNPFDSSKEPGALPPEQNFEEDLAGQGKATLGTPENEELDPSLASANPLPNTPDERLTETPLEAGNPNEFSPDDSQLTDEPREIGLTNHQLEAEGEMPADPIGTGTTPRTGTLPANTVSSTTEKPIGGASSPYGQGTASSQTQVTSPTTPRTATRPGGLANDGRYSGYTPDPTFSNSTTTGRNPVKVSSPGFDPTTPGMQQPLTGHDPQFAEYILLPNDNFWRVSRKVYGTARYFQALAKFNEAMIPDPKHMKPGLKIKTPMRAQLEQQFQSMIPKTSTYTPPPAPAGVASVPGTPGVFAAPTGELLFRVGDNDSLSTISQKTLGRSSRWNEIYELNRDRLPDPDRLAIGTVLRLPIDASQTRQAGQLPTSR